MDLKGYMSHKNHDKIPTIIEIVLSIGFYPNLFQTILLVYYSYLNDKTPITFLFLKKLSHNSYYSNFIVFICFTILTSASLFIGYNLDEIIKTKLIDWFCLLFFFISGISNIIKSMNDNREYSFLNEYNFILSQKNVNNSIFNLHKHELSIIIEESSKYTEENYPLLERRLSIIPDKDINEDTTVQNKFILFLTDIKNVLCERFLDFTYYVILFLCFVYDSGAVIIGVLLTFFTLLLLCVLFEEKYLEDLYEKNVRGIMGFLLIIYSIQLYLCKTFELNEED
jgi:putative Ca2+/H+ antiporter (TMEM165/GDT1 family)